jgi:curved DNA-binding protein CbpA
VIPETLTVDGVRARHALVREGDYFQVLGVPSNAGAAQIARACQQLLAQLSADTVPRSVAEPLAAELAEIRTVVAEAGRLLANESLRRHYRAHLVSSGPAPSGSESASP